MRPARSRILERAGELNSTDYTISKGSSPVKTSAQAPHTESRISSSSRQTWFKVAVLTALVVALELLMFRSYFYGRIIPPWDFLGSYNTDAFLWWLEGGFFTPLDWVPEVWGGYPSALNLQNSAWYIPVGIASLFGPFTLHSSAIVAALNVGLGFVGTYFLARSFRSGFVVSTVVATAGFFGVAYFSNAQHVDIARGYALIPWVLLVLSPTWSWKRWWGIPVGAFILWQAVTGMYPGMIVTTVYAGAIWIAVYQWRSRASLRSYLIPAAIAAVVAVLLSAPRLLPYLLTQESGTAVLPDGSLFSPAMVGTLLFGYSSGELPNDVSMRSFFIPATMLLLAFFARFRDSATAQALAIGIPAALLGLPFWPWFQASQSLPGLGLSRFTMSDFKVFLVLAVLLLATSGLKALSTIDRAAPIPRRIWRSLALAAAFGIGMALIGIYGPFTRIEWFPPIVILAFGFAVIAVWVLLRNTRLPFVIVAATLAVTTIVSGAVWAYTTEVTWRADRVGAETLSYGAPIADLLAERVADDDLNQRPERLEPNDDYTLGDLRNTFWSRAYYTGEYSVGGYLNLKGSLTPEQLEAALLDSRTADDFLDFFAAAGTIATSPADESPSMGDLESCGTEADCGPATVMPAGYDPGHLRYHVSSDSEVTGTFNEAYYKGWQLTACTEDGDCTALEPSRSELGLVQADLPSGDYMLELDYQTPGRPMSWILFGLGIAIAIASAAAVLLGARRDRKLDKRE